MDHNYNDQPFLTNSDYETIMEDLKPHSFSEFGSPFQNAFPSDIEDPPVNRLAVADSQGLPPPPPSEEFGPSADRGQEEPTIFTAPPELSPSLSPTGTIPSRDEYPGHLEFEILLDSATSSKKSWLYSHMLKKVFIDMNKSLLIQFKVKSFMNGLFVRALPVYEQDNFVSIPVTRCGIHALSDDPHFKAHPAKEPGMCYCNKHKLVRHVILSSHSQANYVYNRESDRHSVVVPLDAPHPGTDTTTVEYHFTCKTSCPGGMNRKPIVIIFTLENMQCDVYGRVILPVKICSCPKRDKEKEEKEREEKEKEEADPSKIPGVKPGKRRMSSQEKETKRIKTETVICDVTQEPVSNKNVDSKMLNELEERLQRNDQRLDVINEKIDQINTKIERIDQMNTKIDKKLDLILNALFPRV